ncbi:MAG: hypothetical protein JKX85_13515 [Phycisphaeraceae bacterium]|nr:hypothetical protein [Phycisphaeraceae bacterium]
MPIAQTIFTSLVILAVFFAPLQAGCCMSDEQTQQIEVPTSCCASQMTTDKPASDQPLLPCSNTQGDCPKCNHASIANAICGNGDGITLIHSLADIVLPVCFDLSPLSLMQPINVATDIDLFSSQSMPLTVAQSLCAQHCLMTL